MTEIASHGGRCVVLGVGGSAAVELEGVDEGEDKIWMRWRRATFTFGLHNQLAIADNGSGRRKSFGCYSITLTGLVCQTHTELSDE